MDKTLAIILLRFKLMARAMRGATGALNVASAMLLGLVGMLVAAGLALGFGVMLHALVQRAEMGPIFNGYLIVFYTCCFFGFFLPLLRGALDQGFDAAPFRIFPISRQRLYLITLGACFGSSEHLLYLPTLLAVAIAGVLIPGVNIVAGLVLIFLALVFCVVWSNSLALMLVSIMRGRRAKEILAITALFLVIAASFTPVLLESHEGGPDEAWASLRDAVRPFLWLGNSLPPSLAASGLTALHESGQGMATAFSSLFWLFVWDAAGIVLGYRVFGKYHLGDRSAGGRRRARTPVKSRVPRPLGELLSFDGRLFAAVPVEVRAVAAKDLRYLLRSVAGRFVLFVGPLLAALVMFVGETLQRPVLGIEPNRVLLFGLLFYSVLLSNNFVYNAFAWESDGIRSYFMSPVPLRRVLAGKNLAIGLYNAILFLVIMVTWSVLNGPPDPPTLLTAILLFASAILFFTTCGNVVSVLYPVPRNASSIHNTPSQVAVLLSIVVLAMTVLIVGPFLSIPLLLGWVWLQPVLLALLLAGLLGIYTLSLGMAARLLADRKERVIEALKAPS